MKKPKFIDYNVEPESWEKGYFEDIGHMNEWCKRPKNNKLTTNRLERAMNLAVGPVSILIGILSSPMAGITGDKKYIQEAQAFIDRGIGRIFNNYEIFHKAYDKLHPTKVKQEATA
jgi:hypothetical protein